MDMLDRRKSVPAITRKECRRVARLFSVGRVPVGEKKPLKSVTHGQRDARPTVTFPAAGHHRCCSVRGTSVRTICSDHDRRRGGGHSVKGGFKGEGKGVMPPPPRTWPQQVPRKDVWRLWNTRQRNAQSVNPRVASPTP